MILVIDNYDSFVFNLARSLRELRREVQVYRNDQIKLPEIQALAPEAILLSPGPCGPEEAGICLELLREELGIPILGICLGHQAIAQACGGEVRRCPPMHGKASLIQHDGRGLFRGLSNPLKAGRYHALAVELPPDGALEASAWADGLIMGLRHRHRPLYGLQFHPESILTPLGDRLLARFLEMI